MARNDDGSLMDFGSKPPLGLKPRYVHEAQRKEEILAAIGRYTAAGMKIPMEWIEEYNQLCKEQQ